MEIAQITPLDRRLVHALLVSPRAPFRQLAAVLGVSDQTVRRRYAALRATAGLRITGRMVSAAVGRVDWILRLSCTPDAAVPVASALARRSDTAWVRLASGGTEIHCVFQPRGPEERDALLLDRLNGSRRVLGVRAHALLHTFSSVAWPAWTNALDPDEIARLRAEGAESDSATDDGPGPIRLSETDEILVGLLSQDGRASAARLAAGTGWHESTVRRRVAQLRRRGALYFDMDLDDRVKGDTLSAQLWISTEPSALTTVGTALASHDEVPFVGATTGGTNLFASISCADTGHLYQYLTTKIAALRGVRNVETAPIFRTLKRAGSLVPLSGHPSS